MTKTIDALVEALEKMLPYAEGHNDRGPEGEGWQSDELIAEIKAARVALAQARAEQAEPFGTVTVVKREGCADMHWFYRWPEPPYLDNAAESHTVYTAPPAAPVAKLEPLPIENIEELAEYHGLDQMTLEPFVRAIEAAHNAKLSK